MSERIGFCWFAVETSQMQVVGVSQRGKSNLARPSTLLPFESWPKKTGVSATSVNIITAVDAIDYDDEGKVQHHFVVVALLCEWIAGDPQANDDATDARWFLLAELDDLDLPAAFDLKAIARSALYTTQYR